VIRIPQSAADVLAQLTGPQIKERYPIQRSVYLTEEALAMADELAGRFERDRSAIVRVALALLYALVTAPPSGQVDLFPFRAHGSEGRDSGPGGASR
jgi:hypothetical protein